MKRLLVIPFIVFVLFTPVYGKKILPQAGGGPKAVSSSKRAVSSGVSIVPRLRADRKALTIFFGNLQNVDSVSYVLIYNTQGHEEGAGGSVSSSQGTSTTRELLFGTCSSGVCRYHAGISNMRLEVTTKLKSGKQLLRRYRIRV